MKLVVGLGNPGERYKTNRHNAGFMVVDELAREWGLVWEHNKKINAEIAQSKEHGVILIKPQTFMNDSGLAVSKALHYFGSQPSEVLVIHDDVDLEALQFKISRNASSAGHHGVQSIIDALGTRDFIRLRIGVGRPVTQAGDAYQNAYDVEDYVLQNFLSNQLEVVKKQGIEHLLSSLNV